MSHLKNIVSRDELAFQIGVPLRKLTYVLYIEGVNSYYESFEIPKKNGKPRIINAPQKELKEIQKKLAEKLWEYHETYLEENNIFLNVSHAFEKNKSIISNAVMHKKKKFVLNVDLEDFFQSFHFGRVRGFFNKSREFLFSEEAATVIAQIACYEGSLPQGAPSSPIIANLIFNIVDIRVLKLAKRYRLDYTRYADDLTFSTNDLNFIKRKEKFLKELSEEIARAGFSINENKTRLSYLNSRQEVTGLVVNDKVNVVRSFYKDTRAMADSLYRNGEFYIKGKKGTINQLEGRFSFINQIETYNNSKENKKDKKKKDTEFYKLNSRENEYRKFLFYKYFFKNNKPLIVTEGKTDVLYLKAALKKNYIRYPDLISKNGDEFQFKISFLNRTKILRHLMGIQLDGADTMTNIHNFYTGGHGLPNYYEYFMQKYPFRSENPVVLVFDNEQKNDKPLKKFMKSIGKGKLRLVDNYINVLENLYLLTNPLVNGKEECEIEDLFTQAVLEHEINGKKFSRKIVDNDKYYGKAKFAEYIIESYEEIDFKEFIPMLDNLNTIVKNYK